MFGVQLNHAEASVLLKWLLEQVQWDGKKLGHLGLNLVLPVLSHDTHRLFFDEPWPQEVTMT